MVQFVIVLRTGNVIRIVLIITARAELRRAPLTTVWTTFETRTRIRTRRCFVVAIKGTSGVTKTRTNTVNSLLITILNTLNVQRKITKQLSSTFMPKLTGMCGQNSLLSESKAKHI